MVKLIEIDIQLFSDGGIDQQLCALKIIYFHIFSVLFALIRDEAAV